MYEVPSSQGAWGGRPRARGSSEASLQADARRIKRSRTTTVVTDDLLLAQARSVVRDKEERNQLVRLLGPSLQALGEASNGCDT